MKIGIIQGRFQPLTIAHQAIIHQILQENDVGYVYVVRGNKTALNRYLNPLNKELQDKFFNLILPDNVKVKYVKNGYLPDNIKLNKNNHITLYCGGDRYMSYKNMLKDTNIKVKKVDYDRDGVSASNVRKGIREGVDISNHIPRKILNSDLYKEIENIIKIFE